uniref:Serine carboxypeptidase-like 51 n=1 Tax=Rhizophora mucronata TaxID=61149 RepID=A0A2P2KR09_RHIMU
MFLLHFFFNFLIKKIYSQDIYNFLLDEGMDPVSLAEADQFSSSKAIALKKRYSRYLSSMRSSSSSPDGVVGDTYSLMNGVIKRKLGIIPVNVTWGGQSGYVFDELAGDFMRPRINEVDELLEKGINITVYNGQLDVICATKGTEAWIEKLKWKELQNFSSASRVPLYCGAHKVTKGFSKSFKNLNFYWILGAGHFVPVDQPCIALNMVGAITQSPAAPAQK